MDKQHPRRMSLTTFEETIIAWMRFVHQESFEVATIYARGKRRKVLLLQTVAIVELEDGIKEVVLPYMATKEEKILTVMEDLQ